MVIFCQLFFCQFRLSLCSSFTKSIPWKPLSALVGPCWVISYSVNNFILHLDLGTWWSLPSGVDNHNHHLLSIYYVPVTVLGVLNYFKTGALLFQFQRFVANISLILRCYHSFFPKEIRTVQGLSWDLNPDVSYSWQVRNLAFFTLISSQVHFLTHEGGIICLQY